MTLKLSGCDTVEAETDILDQSALLVFFVLMSTILQVKETEISDS